METTSLKHQGPNCMLCGNVAEILYMSLHDRLSTAPDTWNLVRCKNPACSLIWIDPMPNAAVITKAYETYYTHTVRETDSPARRLYQRLRRGYLATRFGYSQSAPQLWEKIAGNLLALLPHRRAAFDASVMWLPAKSQGRLLEIGCGSGKHLSLFFELGWNAQGLEPDGKAVAVARARGLTVTQGTLAPDLFAPESFDAIVMSHVIEHVPSPQDLVITCHRILRPGGLLVMLTPNTKAFGHHWYGENWLHLDPPRHLNLFNASALCRLTNDAGFSKIHHFSTLRDANWTLAGSRTIRQYGKYQMGVLPSSARLFGMLALYLEWFLMRLAPARGEELVLIARK